MLNSKVSEMLVSRYPLYRQSGEHFPYLGHTGVHGGARPLRARPPGAAGPGGVPGGCCPGLEGPGGPHLPQEEHLLHPAGGAVPAQRRGPVPVGPRHAVRSRKTWRGSRNRRRSTQPMSTSDREARARGTQPIL